MYRLYAMDRDQKMVPVIPLIETEEVVDDHFKKCTNDGMLVWKIFINYNENKDEKI